MFSAYVQMIASWSSSAIDRLYSRYWMVSLPVQNSTTSLWSRLQESISKHSFDTPFYKFNIPNLRVGTLDSLLALSNDFLKSNNFIEGVSHKKHLQIEESERVSGVFSSSLIVDGVPVDTYLTRFVYLSVTMFGANSVP